MATLDDSAPAVLLALASHYGRPAPGLTAGAGDFEALVGALLSRVAEPRKVEATLAALDRDGLLKPEALAGREADPVLDVLKANGIGRTASVLGPIMRLASWLVDGHDGSTEALDGVSTDQIREEWLALNGIGPASADALLLYGLGRAAYPVDRASFRIAARHGWVDPWSEYDEGRAVFERMAPDDPAGLDRLSSWLTRVGRDFCKPGKPRCERCPLRPFLPEGGPRDAEEG